MSMPTPPTGDRQFRDEVVRISTLTVNTSVLDGLSFSNCKIIGPAVFALLGGVEINRCRWNAPDFNALFWEVPPSRPRVIGAVGVRNCNFSSCSFEDVGIAGPPDARAQLESGFSASTDGQTA